MTDFVKLDDNTYVIPQAVLAVQGRFSAELKGTVLVTTPGGTVLVPSDNVPVDLERIRQLVLDNNKPVIVQGPQTLLG
jgi:hypothetical protein